MKKRKLVYGLIFISTLSLLLVAFICHKVDKKNNFRLTDRYVWEKVRYNDTVIIDSTENIIIGAGCITLWAKYPWLYGNILKHNNIFYWAVNIETNQAITDMSLNQFRNFIKKHNISDNLRLLATFGDVTIISNNRSDNRINKRGQKLKKACMSTR